VKQKISLQSPFIQFLLAAAVYYLLTVFIFHKVIFEPNILAPSPDYISGKILMEASEKLAEQGPPLWSPYFFGGMPGLPALHHPMYTYTFFNAKIVQGALGVLFLNPGMDLPVKLMLFHLVMAGMFAYLLARTLGLGWGAAVFTGIVYMFTPQLIVLPGVGHGSKLFTAAYIPLILLTTIRLMREIKPLNFALFVLAVGMTLLSIHVQMAFYALLAGGMYLVWDCIFSIKDKPLKIPVKAGVFFLGIVLGIGFAAASYLPVYEYTPFSIRGGTEGGLGWEYATNWSFHPLESLTYVIPSFFGFGGQTYWGYMPFTDMPLYWGAGALALAVIGIIWGRKRNAAFFIALLLFAWIVSFGKFFPILFKPMFAYFPYFDKFRVPVMIQILMVISVAVLAGYGLERIKDYAAKPGFSRKILYGIGGVIGFAVVFSLLYSPLKSSIGGWIAANRAEFPPQAYGILMEMILGDLWKTALFAGTTLGAVYLFVTKKINFTVLIIAAALILVVDLSLINTKLISVQPRSAMSSLFQPTPAVDYLSRQEKPFRVLPLDRFRPQNWYGYFGIESIDGYMGTKMKLYQELLDSVGLANFNVINMLNTRYLLTDQDLSVYPGFEIVVEGKQKVFLNRSALPRAWMVHRTICLPNAADKYGYMKRFNPWEEAITEEPVSIPGGTGGSVEITEYLPQKMTIRTSSPTAAFLVQSEVYYPPYWKAEVDGNPAKIYQTDHLLRGVVIPAGEHTVIFRCESRSFKLGLTIHYIVMGMILIVLGWYGVKEGKKNF